jgi:hypothetical protein
VLIDLISDFVSWLQLTIVLLDTSSAGVAGTTASPALAAALLPDRNGTDSSSEDGCGSDELLHGCELATVVEVLESMTLLVTRRGSLHCSYICLPGFQIYNLDICRQHQDRRTQEAPCTDEPWRHRVRSITMSSTLFI